MVERDPALLRPGPETAQPDSTPQADDEEHDRNATAPTIVIVMPTIEKPARSSTTPATTTAIGATTTNVPKPVCMLGRQSR